MELVHARDTVVDTALSFMGRNEYSTCVGREKSRGEKERVRGSSVLCSIQFSWGAKPMTRCLEEAFGGESYVSS